MVECDLEHLICLSKNLLNSYHVLGTILDGQQKERWTLLSWSSLSNLKNPLSIKGRCEFFKLKY